MNSDEDERRKKNKKKIQMYRDKSCGHSFVDGEMEKASIQCNPIIKNGEKDHLRINVVQ